MPTEFSFVHNPNATVRFFYRLCEEFRHGKNVFIDAEHTVEASPDAVLTLVSRINDKRFTRGKQVKGSVPTNIEVQELFVEMGFYKYVQSAYSGVTNSRGLIQKRRSKKVEPEIAKTLVEFATKRKFGSPRKCGGIYRILIESMANTRYHASPRTAEVETWWVAAYQRKDDYKISFAFVDNGVGVFNSVKITEFQRTWGPLLGFTSREELLKNIINGTVGSRTGLSYRGKGLPGIKKVMATQGVNNLVFLSNDVIGYVDSECYKQLTFSFDGTLVYWEF